MCVCERKREREREGEGGREGGREGAVQLIVFNELQFKAYTSAENGS